jgi:DNA-binding response OmpR family regulator
MKKILIIDDDQAFRNIVAVALRDEGFEVLEAENGAVGIEMARSQPPHLILSDIHMDTVNGFEALVSFRQDERTSEVPIILMSARTDEDSMKYAIELGANDFLAKPFTIDELVKAITVRLKQKEKLDLLKSEEPHEGTAHITMNLPTDLQAPMSGILGFSEILSRDYEPLVQAEMIELGRAVRKAARRLQRRIQNFSIVAQLEHISLEPKKLKALRGEKTQNLQDLVGSFVVKKADVVGRSGDLTVKIAEATLPIYAEYLTRIVEELLDNALQYSESGRAVKITGAKHGKSYTLSIADQGRGMSGQQLESFRKAASFESRLYMHQGFDGLIVAKRLAEVHGGALAMGSNNDGGLTATLKLPVQGK